VGNLEFPPSCYTEVAASEAFFTAVVSYEVESRVTNQIERANLHLAIVKPDSASAEELDIVATDYLEGFQG
jgi:hypothetical protein